MILFFLQIHTKLLQTSYKYFCSDLERQIIKCPIQRKTVCGWFKKRVNCLKKPCAEDKLNLCTACVDKNIDYVTEGKCPMAAQRNSAVKK